VAAYRSLRAGEAPRPLVYQHVGAADARGVTHTLLVRSWSKGPLQLSLRNGDREACRYTVVTPLGSQSGTLEPAAAADVRAGMPAGVVGEVTVRFESLPGSGARLPGATVEVVP
jgi:hypothetical protein